MGAKCSGLLCKTTKPARCRLYGGLIDGSVDVGKVGEMVGKEGEVGWGGRQC